MYAVTGITGQVGSATARHLLQSGKAVRAVVRNAEKAAPWAAKGCDIAVADMLDRAALASAFSGADAVFVLIPPLFDPSEGFPEMRAILASLHFAIEKAAARRVVCLSTVGAQVARPNLLNQLGLMEKQFAGLSTSVAFLRAAWFMENYIWDVPAARDEGVFRAFLQPLDHAIPMVAVDDIGHVAAALMRESWSGARTVELQGPVDVSANDVARAFTTVLARPVRTEAVPRDQWEAAFRSAGMKNPTPRIQMLDGFNEGWIAFSGDTEQRKGHTTLEQVLAGICDATGVH
jgi:uncharacterized protein YbjT (DUF2867 family)